VKPRKERPADGETCFRSGEVLSGDRGRVPRMRGKRDSAVSWDVAAGAEPATASESAQCGTPGASVRRLVVVRKQGPG
jgi:hypothetical protein